MIFAGGAKVLAGISEFVDRIPELSENVPLLRTGTTGVGPAQRTACPAEAVLLGDSMPQLGRASSGTNRETIR